MIDLDKKITQSDFGSLVGVSQARVSRLVIEGILTAGDPAKNWLLCYCAHIREHAAGRATSGELDLSAERARLASEQADKVAMQNKVSRNEYAPVTIITETLATVGRQIAGILEALPVKLKRNAAMTNDQVHIVQQTIVEARNLAAGVRPDWSQIDVPETD